MLGKRLVYGLGFGHGGHSGRDILIRITKQEVKPDGRFGLNSAFSLKEASR